MDIEDLFEPELFASIVNHAFGLKGKHVLTAKSLDEADPNTVRLVKKAEAAFKVLPDTYPVYDHFTPASWLIQNPDALKGESAAVVATLDRAEKLFEDVNKGL